MAHKAKISQSFKRGKGQRFVLNANGVTIEVDQKSEGVKERKKIGGNQTRIFTKK